MARRTSGPTFRLGDIPVTVEPSFFVVVALFAFVVPRIDAAILWILIATVSVLVHELGHAIAFRAYGSPAAIRLHGMGGLTTGTRLPPARSLVVSLAGPLAGLLLLGVPAVLIAQGDGVTGDTAELALEFVILINVFWSLVNLLPVLPLDGGIVMQSLMQLASGRDSERAARYASIGIAGGAGVLALLFGFYFAVLLAAFALALNVSALGQHRADAWLLAIGDAQRELANGNAWGAVQRAEPVVTGAPKPADRARATDVQTWAWLLAGDRDNAQLALSRRPPELVVPATLQAAVALSHGQTARGVSLVTYGLVHETPAPEHLFAAEAVARAGGIADLVDELLAVEGARGVEAAEAVATIMHHRQRFAEAAAIASRLYADGRADRAVWAYNAACSLARDGWIDESVGWLSAAVAAGWSDGHRLATDPDLAVLRTRPAFVQLEQELERAP